MKLGDKIRKVRILRGLKQDEMADLLNISPQAYSKLERNETKMDEERLDQIAKILEVTSEEIRNIDDKNMFVTTLRECNNSRQSTGTNITNHYYGTESVTIMEKTIQQQNEIICQQKEEILFLRNQLEKVLQRIND